MKYSHIFGNNTLRENSVRTKSISHSMLVRGCFIRSVGNGLYAMLPMGTRVVEKIKKIIKEELDALGGQEINIPMVAPHKLWYKTKRDKIISDELVTFKDKAGHSYVISSSHIEPVTQLAKASMNSYRDFPRFLYQFSSKFRDEKKVGFGLYRSKEFLIKDAYSFHRTYTELNNFFPKVFRAYQNIFSKCGVDVFSAPSAVGSLSGDRAYEFLMKCSWGENIIIECQNCGYKASEDVAIGIKKKLVEKEQEAMVINAPEYGTPEKASTILNIPLEKFALTELYKTLSGWILVLRRADYQVSIEKLSRFIEEPVIGLASKEEVIQQGFNPGYIFPQETNKIKLIADDIISNSNNLVIGSGQPGKYIKNANLGRDFNIKEESDICTIQGTDKCRYCKKDLHAINAIEIANIFNIGTFFAKAIGLSFLEEDGSKANPYMASYGLGIGRLMMAIVESNHDKRGIIWPKGLSPFSFFLMGIGKSFKIKKVSEEIATKLGDLVLYDDRHESTGAKFRDYELLGIPYRIVVSTKNLQEGNVEFYNRKSKESWLVAIDFVKETCISLIAK